MGFFTSSHQPSLNAQRVVRSNATLGLIALIGIHTCQAFFMASKGTGVPMRF